MRKLREYEVSYTVTKEIRCRVRASTQGEAKKKAYAKVIGKPIVLKDINKNETDVIDFGLIY